MSRKSFEAISKWVEHLRTYRRKTFIMDELRVWLLKKGYAENMGQVESHIDVHLGDENGTPGAKAKAEEVLIYKTDDLYAAPGKYFYTILEEEDDA